MNTFYLEFFYPKYPLNDYYNREYNSLKNPEPRTNAEIIAYHDLMVQEAKRRGMMYHAVGHGWNAVFFGNPEVESDHKGTLTVPEDQEKYLALVNGERKKGRPTFIELCYGNPEVRNRLATLVADYAESHPEVDYLHFWLADGRPGLCECELCRYTRVSDFYVMILNDIDRELSRRALSTRIVFLIYNDLNWPPEKEQLVNSDRFVLMFAPGGRSYDKALETPSSDFKLPPYRLNQRKSLSKYDPPIPPVAFLQGWQKKFHGMGFIYDYHMTLHHYYDMGYYGLVKVLAEDIRRLPDLGLNGDVSCIVGRAFYPHGFPLHVKARLLWNPKYNTEDIAKDYFIGAFGEDGLLVMEYMKTLSGLSNFSREKQGYSDKKIEIKENLSRVPDLVRKFQPVISKNQMTGAPVHQLSWKHLSVHSEMVILMADMLRARVEDKRAEMKEAWKKLSDYIAQHEDDTDGVFDIVRFESVFKP